MNTKFKIDPTKIVNLLMNKNILIPVYQRKYRWSAEHVNALIDDLIDREKDNSEHYFGVIAISSTTSSKNGEDITVSKIIDGQQRLTTSLLLLTFLARSAEIEDKKYEKLISINEEYISFNYEMDRTSLKENISSLLLGYTSSLKGQFRENYNVIVSRLGNLGKDYLTSLFETFTKKFIVATLNYQIDPKEEMLVFENLNSKGSPLKGFDLIKNHIISMTKDLNPKKNLKLFNENIWNLTMSLYKDVAKTDSKKEDKLLRFFEMYTIFKKQSTKKQWKKYSNYTVYKNFKDVASMDQSEAEFGKFLFEIKKYLILYLQLETSKGIGKNVWLRTLNNKDNHYAFVFLLFSRFSSYDREKEEWDINKTIEGYLKTTATHVLKIMSVMGTGQSFLKMWTNISSLVLDGNSATTIKKLLGGGDIIGTAATPSERDFTNSLLQAPKQKWIPIAVINILEYASSRELGINETIYYDKDSLEHILPQKAKIKDWPIIEDELRYKETLNQIGNLLNIDQALNSKLGNKSFNDKKKYYLLSSSPFLTGKHFNLEGIASVQNFEFATITRRTKILAKWLNNYLK